ncbi:MAG TPA: MBL fold metallo-hydrolase [Dehalococcoidia bacterium]|nr:MBL fold metallo-hydrolase [Dehalococcoidia bacterium]
MADRCTLGDVQITAVVDMVPPPRQPSAFFAGVTDAQWAPYKEYLENGHVQLYYGCFVVKTAEHTLMVDTGMGPGPHPDRGNLTGNLYEELRPILLPPDNTRNTNVSPSDQINFVVHTHLHADHVGWNLRYQGGMPAPTFRRARYIIPKVDYDYYTTKEMLEKYPHIQKQVMPLRRLRLQELVEGDYSVTGQVSCAPAPGHTPGHQVVMVNAGGQRVMLVGDLLHSPVQVAEPGWCAAVDYDKAQSQTVRERLLNQAEREGWIIAAGHFPPGQQVGKVVSRQGKRRWQPL